MRRTTCLLAGFLPLVLAMPAEAQDQRDAARGRALVAANCDTCHASVPAGRAPSFASVAAMPSTTALALGVFLRTSHPSMPNIVLSPAELDDVIAYILSLKTRLNRP